MPTQILMPALSPTMEEGKLAKWLALPAIEQVVEAAKSVCYV